MRFSFNRKSYLTAIEVDIPTEANATFINGLRVIKYARSFGKVWMQRVEGLLSVTRFYQLKITKRFTYDFDAPGQLYVCVVLHGEFTFNHEHRLFNLSEGDCGIINLTKFARSIEIQPSSCSMIHITMTKNTFSSFLATKPELQSQFSNLKKEGKSIQYLSLGRIGSQVQHIIRNICSSFTSQANGQIFLEAKRYELLAALLNAKNNPIPISHTSIYFRRIESIRTFIENNLDADLSITKLARLFSFSATQLRQAFKMTYGQSIGRFILKIRMERASYLLTHTRLSVSQIALDVGYPHLSSFCRAYKSIYQFSPLTRRHQS